MRGDGVQTFEQNQEHGIFVFIIKVILILYECKFFYIKQTCNFI